MLPYVKKLNRKDVTLFLIHINFLNVVITSFLIHINCQRSGDLLFLFMNY